MNIYLCAPLLADVGLGPVLRDPTVPILTLVVLAVLIVLSETLVLFWLRWAAFPRALLASLLVNTISTLTGVLLTSFLAFMLVFLMGPAAVVIWWVFCLASSIAIEGGILALLAKHPPRQTWKATVLANVVSYVLLIIAVPVVPTVLSDLVR
ncbi:hypothetical protein BST81_18720 [Leptolyngbya sp. 'hensonii']|uniref:hypothetical protein n=1 Tax=Leptolyngbya sp. 'hensonii' TaxID=1922337 RepID=UPI00095027FA|nr:hypothetical protein [Leptolyngbya sp. 'hensonii']OLP17011.1 hypothetical protein BST81_18720 [Leptolyngbya sp. 'hensonii']